MDLTPALAHLEDLVGARGLSWALVDASGQRVVGAETASEMVDAGMALSRDSGEVVSVTTRQGRLGLAQRQAALGWTLLVWAPRAPGRAFDGRFLASAFLVLAGLVALFNLLRPSRG